MIGVFVTFRYQDNFDERAVREIAETARGQVRRMPGLRSKAFKFRKAPGHQLLRLGLRGCGARVLQRSVTRAGGRSLRRPP